MPSSFNTAPEPSRICLGTGSFGSEISPEESFAVLDAYAEAGGNFLDTAHIYAAWVEGGWGASERTLGEWMRANHNREDVVLATKGGHPPLDQLDMGRCGPENLRQDLSESLERLGVDRVDLYWLHRDDPGRPVGEIIDTLAGFLKEGLVGSYGASNWSIARIAAANAYAASSGRPPFAANQPGWSLARRPAETIPVEGMLFADDTTRAWHLKTGLAMAAYSAQAKGYFGNENVAWAEGGFEGPPPRAEEYDAPDNRQRLQAAARLAREKGCTANQIALAWLLHQPFPVYPIVGTRNPGHIRESLEAESIELTEEDIRVLNTGLSLE